MFAFDLVFPAKIVEQMIHMSGIIGVIGISGVSVIIGVIGNLKLIIE